MIKTFVKVPHEVIAVQVTSSNYRSIGRQLKATRISVEELMEMGGKKVVHYRDEKSSIVSVELGDWLIWDDESGPFYEDKPFSFPNDRFIEEYAPGADKVRVRRLSDAK